MVKLVFIISFFITGGNIIDSKLRHHKYDKEDYKEIFYLNSKESTTIQCIKHAELEDVKKIKYHHHNEGQKIKYKVTKSN